MVVGTSQPRGPRSSRPVRVPAQQLASLFWILPLAILSVDCSTSERAASSRKVDHGHRDSQRRGVKSEHIQIRITTRSTSKTADGRGPLGFCSFGQNPTLRGTWDGHVEADHGELYRTEDCPGWTHESDRTPYMEPAVFKAEGCDLHPWSAAGFDTCFGGRRLIMIGDSHMRQVFSSLGCLLNPMTVQGDHFESGSDNPDSPDMDTAGASPAAAAEETSGSMYLQNGGSIHLRSFARIDLELWDDAMAEFGPLTEKDVIVINLGAWYSEEAEEVDFKAALQQLFRERLQNLQAAVFWSDYSPPHFGVKFPAPPRWKQPIVGLQGGADASYAALGREQRHDKYIQELIRDCGPDCFHIRKLPISDFAQYWQHNHPCHLQRNTENGQQNSRQLCRPTSDMWNVILYNMECFGDSPTGKQLSAE